MCGIVGVLALNAKSIYVDYTKSMADRIAHRGPDDAGYLYFNSGSKQKKNISYYQNLTDEKFKHKNFKLPVIEKNYIQKKLRNKDYDIYMGHRRLSIIDISEAGHQPMSDSSKNIWISFNGEIYNFKEIRSKLKKLGHKFTSETDTEVIIYAYIQWGIKCIKKFNGMFAFSLYDNIKKKFFLCRDRYGVKPLYYHVNRDKTFIYGSEIKSILEYKDYKSTVDKEALIEYFTFQNIFTNKTFNKNIQILEAAHYFEIDLRLKKFKKIKYWDFNFSEPEIIKDEREYLEELDRLFSNAVKRQLVSDVPLGCYLSGGIDSCSIAAVAAKEFKKPHLLKTFTVGFDLSTASGLELSFDERAKAKFISNKLNTNHYETVLKSRDMEKCLPNFTYHLEEPRVGQSYPNYYAAKLASKSAKVVLSGVGGDELFAGYPWRYFRFCKNKNLNDYINKYYKFWQRLIPNKEIKKLFSPISENLENVWTQDIFKNVFQNLSLAKTSEDYINHSLYFEAKTFLHGLLVVEDKLSMAHSIESRVPFLDNDLVDYVQKIPVRYKLQNLNKAMKMDENQLAKFQKTNNGKIIFRKYASKYLPKKVSKSIKQGFSSPDRSWFKGESIKFVKRKIYNKNSSIYKYIDKKTTRRLVDRHLTGKENKRLLVWSLLNFEQWLKKYGK